MTPIPNEQITDSILRMRTSLARIELAASRLARDAMTPVTRDFVAGISEAVREIDDEISDSLRTLRAEPNVDPVIGDCSGILSALHERIAPILETYEIRWPRLESDGDDVLGDLVQVELVALHMLRAGIALAGRAGTIDLSLMRDTAAPRIGLCLLSARCPEDILDSSTQADELAPIRALAHRYEGEMSVRETESGPIVTFWLAPTEVL